MVKKVKKKKGEALIRDKQSLAAALSYARKEAGFSKKRLSIEVGCSTHMINKLEAAEKEKVVIEELKRMSDVISFNLLPFVGIKKYTLKTKSSWDYKLGQKIRLEDGTPFVVFLLLNIL